MIYLWATLLVAVNAVWLALTAVTLPGNWLMVATTALVAWWQWDKGMFHPATLAAVAALAVVGEVVETFASSAAVRRVGGSRRGGWGALLGGIVGAVAGTFLIPLPLFGSLIGACLGAAGGAWLLELSGGRTQRESIRSAAGAGVGRLLATVAKCAIGAAIWLIIAVAAFWP